MLEQDSRKPGGRRELVLAITLVANLLMMSTNIMLDNQRSLLGQIVYNVASPLQVAFHWAVDQVDVQVHRFLFLRRSHEKYRDLRREYARVQYENQRLRAALGRERFGDRHQGQAGLVCPARVIAMDPGFPFGQVTLNRGVTHGVAAGMVVLNGEGHLVGRIMEPVALFTARVRLITQPQGGVGVSLARAEREALLVGNGSSLCVLQYLMERIPVEVGEEVLTSGTDKLYPPGIPIGRVVRREKEYLVQKVWVRPYWVQESLQDVLVVGGGDDHGA